MGLAYLSWARLHWDVLSRIGSTGIRLDLAQLGLNGQAWVGLC